LRAIRRQFLPFVRTIIVPTATGPKPDMSTLIRKLSDCVKHEGFFNTIPRVIRYPFVPLLRRRAARTFAKALTLDAVEDRFDAIYKSNLWLATESASGPGSTLRYTENLRKKLPALITEFSIKHIFDAACGDFYWMRHLLPAIDIGYVGADIVGSLVESNNAKYQNNKVSFIRIDLIKDPFPKSDLMICRDCLFHFSYEDTKSVLRNFIDSGIPYLLTTTHKTHEDFSNTDITTGEFRMIDLFAPPYNFSQNPLARIDDWIPPWPERQMCLWNREQVCEALERA
jgi:hypothetical protein